MDTIVQLYLVLEDQVPKDLIKYIISKYIKLSNSFKISRKLEIRNRLRIHNNYLYWSDDIVDQMILASGPMVNSIFIKFILHSGMGKIATGAQLRELGFRKINTKITNHSKIRGYIVCEMSIIDIYGNIQLRECIPIEVYNRILYTTDNLTVMQLFGKYIASHLFTLK